jgi:hypothetical protein
MSIVQGCDTANLELDDIFRLVSAVDVDGNFYIRVYDDGTDPDTLDDLVECQNGDITMLDILRGALVTNDEGEYALNVASLS